MNCALIDEDNIDAEDEVVVVDCVVNADGIVSTGMHEKRGEEEDENGGKGTRRGVVVEMMEVGEV